MTLRGPPRRLARGGLYFRTVLAIRRRDPFMSRSTSQLVRLTTILAILSLFVLWIVPWKDEASTWRLAAAERQWNSGDREQALETLRELTERSPDRIDWLMQSIKWSLEQDQPEEAIEAADVAIKLLGSEGRGLSEDAWQFVQFKAFALARLGRGSEAIEVCQPFAETVQADEPGRLNGLAYVAALAGQDLDKALERIERVLADYDWPEYEKSHRLALVAYDAKNLSLAHRWINRAIGEFEPVHRRFNLRFADQIAALGAGAEGDGEQFRAEVTRLRSDREQLNRRRAMLHSQRAAIRSALDQEERAQADRRVVESLGFDPDELVNLRFVDDRLGPYTSFLDTRAWVHFRRGELRKALSDMNEVLAVAEVRLEGNRATYAGIRKQIVRSELFERDSEEARRIVAIFYQHRATIHRALGDELRAFADEIQVRRLGQTPGDHLY